MIGRFFPKGSTNPILFTTDFSTLSLGKYDSTTFLSETNLNYARTTNGNAGVNYKSSTVQTSASTIVSGLMANDAGIGSPNGIVKGLVIQNNIGNWIGNANGLDSPRDLNIAWLAGTATVTSDAIAGPDGISPGGGNKGATRCVANSGAYSPYGVKGITTDFCWSIWQKNNGNTVPAQPVYIDNYPPAFQALTNGAGIDNVWERVVVSTNSAALTYLAAVDSRDYSGVGGTAALNRDSYVDYMLLTEGKIPFEAIPTAFTFRYNDRLSYANGANLVDNGRINFNISFYPKGASNEDIWVRYEPGTTAISEYWYLWSFGSSDYARINATDKKIEVSVGGVTATSTNAISWSRQDLVEIYLQTGGNVASSAKYRINNGSWNNLNLTSTLGLISPPDSLKLLHDSSVVSPDNGDTKQLVCWLKHITFYNNSFNGI